MLLDTITYIQGNFPQVIDRTGEHISLSFTAVGLAALVGIPLAFLVLGNRTATNMVTSLANIIQTIPSLALFAFAMPFFGIGTKPAIFALFLYALLPIIKNSLLGMQNVNPAMVKAARGMGMTRAQVMLKVEIPLAIPTMMGGVRIAAVTGIGIATIATLIGAGGLGSFIYQGLGMSNQPMILTGAIFSALLALLVDFILSLVENLLTPEGLKIAQNGN